MHLSLRTLRIAGLIFAVVGLFFMSRSADDQYRLIVLLVAAPIAIILHFLTDARIKKGDPDYKFFTYNKPWLKVAIGVVGASVIGLIIYFMTRDY